MVESYVEKSMAEMDNDQSEIKENDQSPLMEGGSYEQYEGGEDSVQPDDMDDYGEGEGEYDEEEEEI